MKDILEKALDYENTYRVIGRAHYIAAEKSALFNRLFGIPVIVITAVVGTTIFGTLKTNPDAAWKIGAGLFSLAGTVLSSLQTSLGFAQTAEKHKSAGESYRAIRRRFEMFRLRYKDAPDDQRGLVMDALEAIVEDLAGLPKEFPTIPEKCYQKAAQEDKEKQRAATQ